MRKAGFSTALLSSLLVANRQILQSRATLVRPAGCRPSGSGVSSLAQTTAPEPGTS